MSRGERDATLRYAVLCYAMLCYAMLCDATLWLRYAMLGVLDFGAYMAMQRKRRRVKSLLKTAGPVT